MFYRIKDNNSQDKHDQGNINSSETNEENVNNQKLNNSTLEPKKDDKIKAFFKNEIIETKLLLKSVPSWVLVTFVLSVAFMNLFANKSIETNVSWLALDCGIILSWASFLSMDIIVKRFGAKASTKISVLVLILNLIISFIFFLVSVIPGFWGESFIEIGGDIANTALNNTLSGNWFVILGSSIAFLSSSLVNNLLNALIGKCFKKKNFLEYSLRTYISTMIGQFVDNLIFALIVSLNFFGWTITQCVTCAITGAIVELVLEIIFSPIGYKVCNYWDKNNVGQEYLNFINNKSLNI